MNHYNSKLLLFGEHIIIKGTQALAIPFLHFYGTWKYASSGISELQMNLKEFAQYLESLQMKNELLCELDVSSFKNELEKDLYFQSNIPTGYGVGSSGALCAAVYDVFCKNKKSKTSNNLLELKKIFAQLESFFHGSSSGTDPLVCYIEKPLLLSSKNNIQLVSLPELDNSFTLFILDTKISRKTGPLVDIFLEKYNNVHFANRCQSELMPDNEDAIDAFLNKNVTVLLEKMHNISHFQFKYFQEMIPDEFRTLWLDGLADNLYKLKLCGAGGGGFILGITTDFEKTKKKINDYQLIKIFK